MYKNKIPWSNSQNKVNFDESFPSTLNYIYAWLVLTGFESTLFIEMWMIPFKSVS